MHGCTYSIIPDQIEAGSYMVAAAITGGNVLIENVIPEASGADHQPSSRRAGVDQWRSSTTLSVSAAPATSCP